MRSKARARVRRTAYAYWGDDEVPQQETTGTTIRERTRRTEEKTRTDNATSTTTKSARVYPAPTATTIAPASFWARLTDGNHLGMPVLELSLQLLAPPHYSTRRGVRVDRLFNVWAIILLCVHATYDKCDRVVVVVVVVVNPGKWEEKRQTDLYVWKCYARITWKRGTEPNSWYRMALRP